MASRLRVALCRTGVLAVRTRAWAAFAPLRPISASARRTGKLVPFNLPDIGEGIAEVEIIRWNVKEGDRIRQFDKLVDVQSDKASVEITSRFDGVVKQLKYKAGDMAATGKPLCEIEVEGVESPPHVAAGAELESPPSPPAAVDAVEAARVKALATPAVRRLARELKLDLTDAALGATGKGGRVTKEDVLKYVEARDAVHAATPAPAPVAAAPVGVVSPPPPPPGVDTVAPVRGLARAMVKSMTAAWSIPHFGYGDDFTMDAVMHLRTSLAPVAKEAGVKLTFLPIIIKAFSTALRAHPSLNAHAHVPVGAPDDWRVLIKSNHNIGVAMDSPRGLIVPNIKAVQERSIMDIARELMRLQVLAAAGKLTEPELVDGTFTLSNVGVIGGTHTSPVLFAPQVAIAAIGAIRRVPVFAARDSTQVVPAHIMSVSFSADHRVVDGATVARFSNAVKAYLDDPARMLAELR